MSDHEATSSPTRRWLLTGAALGGSALAAQAIRPADALAADGDALTLGTSNEQTSSTSLEGGDTALNIRGGQIAIEAQCISVSGIALRGLAEASSGTTAVGVEGRTRSDTGCGVRGSNSGSGNGIFGLCDNPGASGVYGQNDGTVFGVAGRAADGTGVLADSTNGVALSVVGKARFSRSGRKTIAAGATHATVSLEGVSRKSMVMATAQKHVAGVFVQAAVPASASFTIWLNKAAPTGGIPVAWQVLD